MRSDAGSGSKGGRGAKLSATARKRKPGGPSSRGPGPIVGIGASAGGLEAFERLLKHLPNDFGMSYVLVQHLDPTHESHLTEIFSRATRMPVTEVRDGMRVAPNRVYIIPPNTNMVLYRGALKLVPRPSTSGHHMPIDFFFHSLAESQGHRAVGVILSGTASDGAAGMKAIKVAGGITFAQDMESAKYYGMPQSSISAGAVDFILRPEEIAKELETIARQPYLHTVRAEEADVAPVTDEQDGALQQILRLLGTTFGVDFEQYKQSTLYRRIRRRMAMHSRTSFRDYLAFLNDHPAEIRLLHRDMFINVSGFFREADAFRRLKRTVFPNFFRNRHGDSPVRVWVPGCSTGEEAYSLAISLLEYIRQKGRNVRIQVFATDISDEAVQMARKGRYLADTRVQVDSRRLNRWFTKTEDGYQIIKAVRDSIVFAKHDITKDPPFSRLDLISCRNLLIYLGVTLQRKLIPLFHYALKPGGYLFLGAAETVGTFSDLFSLVDKKHKIYSRKSVYGRQTFDASANHFPVPAAETPAMKIPVHRKSAMEALKEAADITLLNEFAPASVLVNDQMEILQFRGRTGPYLEPASGTPTLELFKMAREGLLPDLQTALHESQKKNLAVRRDGVRIHQNGNWRIVGLHVTPVRTPLSKEVCYLVTFLEPSSPAPRRPAKGASNRKLTAAEEANLERIAQLRQELSASKAYLQSVIDKHEASNEELRSLNEEIMSSNEELQSTSEELETANEELQSANEELTTLNEELQNRNQEISRANNDTLNILTSMNMSLIMLDLNLRIRRFTPTAQSTFNLITADVGRPITDIRLKISLPNLEENLRAVIAGAPPIVENLQDPKGAWYLMQLRAYTTTENKVDGAVIAFADISGAVKQKLELKLAVAGREHAEDQLRDIQRRMVEAAASSRDAMAREIHDSLSQVLAGVIVQLGAAEVLLEPGQSELKTHIARAQETAHEGLEQTRRTARAWRKGEQVQLGELPKVLNQICLRLFSDTGVNCRTSFQENRTPLPAKEASNLLMVAQEALVNVLLHARATEVSVDLRDKDPNTVLTIRDNGEGFDFAAARDGGGFGLLSMRERVEQMGGKFRIQSAAGKGATVEARVPNRRLSPGS